MNNLFLPSYFWSFKRFKRIECKFAFRFTSNLGDSHFKTFFLILGLIEKLCWNISNFDECFITMKIHSKWNRNWFLNQSSYEKCTSSKMIENKLSRKFFWSEFWNGKYENSLTERLKIKGFETKSVFIREYGNMLHNNLVHKRILCKLMKRILQNINLYVKVEEKCKQSVGLFIQTVTVANCLHKMPRFYSKSL